jgi:hypothetical protein
MTRVELFEAIRRDHEIHGKSIREIARERSVHRRAVRQALDNAVPPKRKRPKRSPPVLTPAHRATVDRWLVADCEAPRKQRHTARRVFRRLRSEEGYDGAESTVRKYVGRRRRELGLLRGGVYVPLDHPVGKEGEVDWYEADVDFPWGRQRVQFFQMRACYSGREFHMGFPRQTQQAFLEGHVEGFAYFGGVFEVMRYDNLTAAVKRVLQGRRREETDRFVALRSHYLFESEFCRPGTEGASEKGGVENAVGRFRRSHMVPVPRFESFEELNRQLLVWCAEDDLRRVEGRQRTVLQDWDSEKDKLLRLPDRPFSTEEVSTARVDAKGRICVRTNRYSVPIRLARGTVEVRVHARWVEAWSNGRLVAVHDRLQGLHGERLELDHYLELLWTKPGALGRSRPLRQARDRGRWPACYDELWQQQNDAYGATEGARQLLAVLLLHRAMPADAVHTAVELALELGTCDASAICVLARQLTDEGPPPAERLGALGELARYDRPVLDLGDYDALLGHAGQQEVQQ